MQVLNVNEIDEVSGGIEMETGGLFLMGLAFVTPVGMVTAAAMGIGLGLVAMSEYYKIY